MNRGRRLAALALLLAAPGAGAMGLRSLVALPVERDAGVLRLVAEHADEADRSLLTLAGAWGLSPRDTLLFALPYRLSPGGGEHFGDLDLLYRRNLYRRDGPGRTTRFAGLAGLALPLDDGEAGVQLGAVATRYAGRQEWDADFIYRSGAGPDSARADLAWQYRLAPARYPDWGVAGQWNAVAELGLRWREGGNTLPQFTLGLQHAGGARVLEAGLVQDLDSPDDTRLLLGLRWHWR